MAEHVFNLTAFRAQFPQFASDTIFPNVTLEGYWAMATQYISKFDGCRLYGDPLQLALNLMTAHLAALYAVVNAAGFVQPGIQTNATIDKVSVTVTPPPFGTSMWRYWLAQTPYGVQLLALLSVKSVGGWAVGGSLERMGVRKAGGRF